MQMHPIGLPPAVCVTVVGCSPPPPVARRFRPTHPSILLGGTALPCASHSWAATIARAQKRETNEVQQKYADVIAKYLIMQPDYAITHRFEGEERGFLKLVARPLQESSRPFCLINLQDEAVQWCVGLPANGSKEILAELLPIIDGKGGGKPPLWQGVGSGSEKAHEFLKRFAEIVKNPS